MTAPPSATPTPSTAGGGGRGSRAPYGCPPAAYPSTGRSPLRWTQSSGEPGHPRPTATGPFGDELVARIAERMSQLRTGDGRRGCDMGPLVTAAHRDRVTSYIDAGVQAGAKLIVDGAVPLWMAVPTAFGLDQRSSTMCRPRRPSTPTRSSGRSSAWCGRHRSTRHSTWSTRAPTENGTAIFTTDGSLARRFQSEVEVGMVGINVPIPVPAAAYSFGGWKSSLFGDTHAYGPDGVHFFTRSKVVTSRWPRTTAPHAHWT